MKRVAWIVFCLSIFAFSNCKSKKKIVTKKNETNKAESLKNKALLDKYSAMVGEPVHNIKLYTFIDKMYGTPHKSKDPSGYDCSGFAALLYREMYGVIVTGSSASIYKQCKTVSISNLNEGDFVFFKINPPNISHIGVYLGNSKFVHASTSRGVMISGLEETYWKKHFVSGGKLK